MSKDCRILIVDDEPNNFLVIDSFLYPYNYELIYITNGKEAIAQIDKIQPDLILLDVMMPELNGIEVCKIIKNNQKWQSIPIIMVTALTDKNDLAYCLENGADDFLSKPINSFELKARVQSMLRIKKQYESLNKLIKFREDIVNMMIHDFRNSLTTIVLAANFIKSYQFSLEKFNKKLNQIIKSAQTLKQQMNHLFKIAKIESGELILSLKLTNLNSLCESIIDAFKLIAFSQNIELIANIPSSPIYINIDVNIFTHIIENLLSNAIKFSSENSQIILEIGYYNPEIIYLKVIDFGEGVAAEDKEKIFEKYQIGNTIKEVNQIGLGLSFCQMAVKAHGGTIAVEDNVPNGAIFTIKLFI